MTQQTSPDEPIRAHMTCGPFTGLRVTGDDGTLVLYHDPVAKVALIKRAVRCLEEDVMILEKGGKVYALQGGPAAALHILQAMVDRG